MDLLDTFLHIFVTIIIYDHDGQQYFAISMKDYHVLQNTVKRQPTETENVI